MERLPVAGASLKRTRRPSSDLGPREKRQPEPPIKVDDVDVCFNITYASAQTYLRARTHIGGQLKCLLCITMKQTADHRNLMRRLVSRICPEVNQDLYITSGTWNAKVPFKDVQSLKQHLLEKRQAWLSDMWRREASGESQPQLRPIAAAQMASEDTQPLALLDIGDAQPAP
jgi:hypothetical protein